MSELQFRKTKDPEELDRFMHGMSVFEGRLLCTRMQRDIEKAAMLSMKYPGQIHEMIYETIAKEPIEQYEQLYESLGLQRAQEVEEFIAKATNAKGAQIVWSVSRQNSSQTAHKWEELLQSETKLELLDICRDVLEHMGLISS